MAHRNASGGSFLIALRRFLAKFIRLLSEAGPNRLGQLFGAVVAPIIVRRGLDKMTRIMP